MDSFTARRQQARTAARAFWRAYTRTAATGQRADQQRAAADRLLSEYFPALSFQVASSNSEGQILEAAFSSANKTAPLADAQILAETAPSDLPFRIHPWLQRHLQTSGLNITFDGATVSADRVFAACSACSDGLIRLDIHAGSQLPPEHSGQQLAVWHLLAAVLGQWDLNVKVAEIAFTDIRPANAVPLSELPTAFDRFWQETLGHNGIMPAQAQYAAYSSNIPDSNGQPPAALTAVWLRNESAAALLGRRENAWCLRITCEIYDALSSNWTEEIRHAFTHITRTDGVLTTLSKDWREGRFQICAAVGNPDRLYEEAESIARKYTRIDAQAECVFDPSWVHYRL